MKATRALAVFALVADTVLSGVFWRLLPERVPVHWDFTGQANGYGSKLELVLAGPLAIAGLWLLMLVLSRIDPRRAERAAAIPADAASGGDEGSYWTVIHLLVVTIALLHGAVLLVASGMVRGPGRVIGIGLGLFLLLVGNFIGRVRPNWFVGIRTPWTLASDDVWRRTHRLAATLMVAGGALLLPLALLLDSKQATSAAILITLAATLGPAVWSYFAWREVNRAGGAD